MHPYLPPHRSPKGFTLIELLVVIAIIAILAAILFPVFAQAKRAAKDTAAISNVKNTSTAMYLYAGDVDDATVLYEYDGEPWQYTAWPILVHPYIKSVDLFYDPSQNVKPTPFPAAPWNTSATGWWGWQTQATINLENYAAKADWGVKHSLTGIEHMSQRIAFTYGEAQNPVGQNSQHWFYADEASCSILSDNRQDWWWSQKFNGIARNAQKNHNDGIITGFADGHAKKVPRKKMILDVPDESTVWSSCRNRNWGPDGQRGTADDLDNEVTRYWGRAWDLSY